MREPWGDLHRDPRSGAMWEFGLTTTAEWTLGLYLFVSAFALVFCLLCALLFPSDLEGSEGYRDYFMSRRAWFFGLLALAYLSDLALATQVYQAFAYLDTVS